VISAYSRTEGAVKLIDYLTSADVEKTYAAKYSIAPVLNATYDDPAVQKALPFAASSGRPSRRQVAPCRRLSADLAGHLQERQPALWARRPAGRPQEGRAQINAALATSSNHVQPGAPLDGGARAAQTPPRDRNRSLHALRTRGSVE